MGGWVPPGANPRAGPLYIHNVSLSHRAVNRPIALARNSKIVLKSVSQRVYPIACCSAVSAAFRATTLRASVRLVVALSLRIGTVGRVACYASEVVVDKHERLC